MHGFPERTHIISNLFSTPVGIVEVYRLAKRVYRPFREKKDGI